MRRGTTPTHHFTLPFDSSMVERLQILYAQNDNIVLKKEKEDCDVEGNQVRLTLTQEETFLFNPASNVQIQLRVRASDGSVFGSHISVISVKQCLNDEVL